MAISDWDKNKVLKFTIDNTYIDEDLTDFPVLLNIREGSGVNNFDCSALFTELDYPAVTGDTFDGEDGDAPNPLLWDTVNSTTAEISNNLVSLTGSIKSFWALSATDNFDIQVDYDCTGAPNSTGWSIELAIYTESSADAYIVKRNYGTFQRYASSAKDSGVWQPSNNIGTSDYTGKFRTVKTGNTITGYYWSGSDWVFIQDHTFTTIDDNIHVSLVCNVGQYKFNNFTVNSGTIVWPSDKHPNRKKIALVYPSVQEHQAQEYDNNTKFYLLSNSSPNGPTVFEDSSEYNKSVTAYGNTSHSISESIYGTSSIYFDGSGDYLSIPDSTHWQFGTGDFTIEFWTYCPSITASNNVILGYCNSWSTLDSWYIDWGNSHLVKGTGSANAHIINISRTTSTWQHIAIARENGVLRSFTNGLKVDEVSYTSVIGAPQSSSLLIGKPNWSSAVFNGYIDDLRITKGVARYTADFTPPTGPSEKITKTYTYIHGEQEQLFCEIERWDHLNKSAQLWVKVPKVLYNQPTDLFLYYDKTQPDNTQYVGNIGELAAQQVWDKDYNAVYHLSQDPSLGGACIKDSTSNSFHGTPNGAMISIVDGVAGSKATTFDAVDDHISCGTFEPRTLYKTATLESLYTSEGDGYMLCKGNDNLQHSYGMSTGYFNLSMYSFLYHTAITWCNVPDPRAFTVNDNYAAMTITSAGTLVNYLNGNYLGTSSNTGTYNLNTNEVRIGSTNRAAPYTYRFKGTIREARFSQIVRTEEWLKATYYSTSDKLCTVASGTIYTFSGYIKELGEPVERTLYLYDRASGALMDKTISNYLGYYMLKTTVSGSHNIVCLDAETSPEFDDQIISKVTPTEVI
jgi:hypothetical protein